MDNIFKIYFVENVNDNWLRSNTLVTNFHFCFICLSLIFIMWLTLILKFFFSLIIYWLKKIQSWNQTLLSNWLGDRNLIKQSIFRKQMSKSTLLKYKFWIIKKFQSWNQTLLSNWLGDRNLIKRSIFRNRCWRVLY